MLALTTEAIEAVKGIVESEELPDGSGLRISGGPLEGDELELELDFADEPEAGDEVVEADGARVFVAGDLAPLLADQQLGAHQHGDHYHFSIDPQAA